MSTSETIYLDNAATSYPKPESVYEAVDHVQRQLGANPGRGTHRLAVEGQGVLALARQRLAELFAISEPDQIVFTKNATEALNLAIKGCAGRGGHVVTTTVLVEAYRSYQGCPRKREKSGARFSRKARPPSLPSSVA